MNKAWPLLAILAALAVVYFVLDPFGNSKTVSTDDTGRAAPQAPSAPGLSNANPRVATPEALGGMHDAGSEAPPDAAPEGAAISGTVVDDATGVPIPGSTVGYEDSRDRCPRLPEFAFEKIFGAQAAWTGISNFGVKRSSAGMTTKDGSFSLPSSGDDRMDLFARASGYVLGCVCTVNASSSPVTIRLQRGAEIRGRVERADGRPIAGATVDAKPGPGTPNLPGHVERAESDKEGNFTLTGLLPGALALTADHPKFVPTTLEPMEPGGTPIRIVLIPALVTLFAIHTDTGKEPENPSLAWTTSSVPPKSGLLLLPHRNPPPDADPGTLPDSRARAADFGPVRVPCDAPDATFEVKAVGYEAWKSAPEPLPPEGGERTLDVPLSRDLTLGSLKLTFEDRDGAALSYVGEKGDAHLWRRDNRPVPAGIVIQPGEALVLPALPAGPYGVLVRSPGHAPAIVQAEVAAGKDGEQRVVLGPPAKLRVKFTAVDAVLVHFRVLWNGVVAYPFPEGAATVSESEGAGGEPVFHAGADGLLLSGLGAGRHTVEVVSPDLAAPPTNVDLVEGETREVEIAVTKR